MNVSSDETETMTDHEDSSTEEGGEEEEEESDGDASSGIQSASESMLQSSEGESSSSDHVGLKQPAVFLTQVMGDFKQKQSHIATHMAGSGNGPACGETATPGDSRSLIQAVKDGNLGKLRELLKGRQHVSVTDSNRRTPLHIACSLGRQEMVQLFIKIGMNVDACSIVGQTPLHETCIGGHYSILKILITEVADLDAVDNNGLSAAHYCALNGEVQCLDLLCEQVNYLNMNYMVLTGCDLPCKIHLGSLICREGPGNHCIRMHQLYQENLIPCIQAFSVNERALVQGYSTLSLVLRPSLSW